MSYDFALDTLDGSTDSPWDENAGEVREAEWTKISSDFTNVRLAHPYY